MTYNRNIKAGTIIGSGTVSNELEKQVGSACLAEGVAIEIFKHGSAKSNFIQPNEIVEMNVLDHMDNSVFGSIRTKFLNKN